MIPLNYLLFLQIILFLFISPGSPRVLIVSYSINYGMKKSIWTALGDISANIVQMIIVIFGMSTLIYKYPELINIIKWLGILYLLYLAFEIYKSQIKNIESKSYNNDKNSFSFYKDGFIVAGLSPKAWIFIGTIFPTFINFDKNYIIQFLILGITYITLDFITLMIYGLVAKRIVVWLKANPRTINIISSVALIIIAIVVAFL